MLVVLAPSSHFYGCTEGQSHTKWVEQSCSGKVEERKHSEWETLQRVVFFIEGLVGGCTRNLQSCTNFHVTWSLTSTLNPGINPWKLPPPPPHSHSISFPLFKQATQHFSNCERTRIPLRLMWEPDTFHISYVVTTTSVLPQSYCSHSTNRQGSTTCEFVLCDASTLRPLWKPTHTNHKAMLKDKGCPPLNLFDEMSLNHLILEWYFQSM